MAIIDSYRNICTVFEKFGISSHEYSLFLAEFSQLIKESTSLEKGLISANFHYSQEKEVLMNYSQWKSEENYWEFRQGENSSEKKKWVYGYLEDVWQTQVVFLL